MIANIHTIESDDGTGWGISDRKCPDVGNRSAIITTMATDPNMSTRLNRIATTFIVVNKAQPYVLPLETMMAYDRLRYCMQMRQHLPQWVDVHMCPDCDKPMICDLHHDDPCTCRTYLCECSECNAECGRCGECGEYTECFESCDECQPDPVCPVCFECRCDDPDRYYDEMVDDMLVNE